MIGLHLAAPRFTESVAWGLWPVTYLPALWRWTLALLAAICVLFGDRLRAPREASQATPAKCEASPRHWRIKPWQARLAATALALVLFYAFRIQHLRWGDAYLLVKAIPHPEAQLTYVWQAPLDVWVHAKAWAAANRLFGWPDPIPVYWLISAIVGAVFVWALLGFAKWLGNNRVERALLIGLVLSLGVMELFFGYIENYTIMTLGVLLYLWSALRSLNGEGSLTWTAAILALTHAFHPSTIILAPSLVYLAWTTSRPENGPLTQVGSLRYTHAHGRASFGRNLVRIAIPYALVVAGVVALMSAGSHGLAALMGADFPGGGDRRWFVPLFETTTRWEHYTMFSLGHLVDIANEQLLVAPVVLPSLILVAAFAWRRLPVRDPAFRFLAFVAACYLLLILTWNPDYGGQRDWDLFAPAALPLTVLLAYVLPRALPEIGALRAASWALVTAQAYCTIAWVYQNTLPLEIR